MTDGDICTRYTHSFPNRPCGSFCLTISCTPHHVQVNKHTQKSSSSSPKRSCQLTTKFQLNIFNIPPLPPPAAGAAACQDDGHGLLALESPQFPPQPRLWPKENVDKWLSFSHGMALKLDRNDSPEEKRMKWFTLVLSSQVERARLFFSRGRSAISLPARAASRWHVQPVSLLLWICWSASRAGWKVNNFPSSSLRVLRS